MSVLMKDLLVCVFCGCSAVESPERQPGGGEPPPAESDQPAESAEPHTAGEEHGEQGDVPPGAEALHVTQHLHYTHIHTQFFRAHSAVFVLVC